MSEGGGASSAGAAGAAVEAEAPPSVPATLEERSQGRRVIVILKRVSTNMHLIIWRGVPCCPFAIADSALVDIKQSFGVPTETQRGAESRREG